MGVVTHVFSSSFHALPGTLAVLGNLLDRWAHSVASRVEEDILPTPLAEACRTWA
jgi:hypothetical protein